MGGDMKKFREMRPAKAKFAQELLEKNPKMTESNLKGRGVLKFGSWVDSRLTRDWVKNFRETGSVLNPKEKAKQLASSVMQMVSLQSECKSFLESLKKDHSNLITMLQANGVQSFEVTLGDTISMGFEKLVKEREEFEL